MIRAFFRFALLLFLAWSSHAQQREQRVALVIGNGAYQSSPLKNPVNDATDMAQALKDKGFAVTLRTNIGTKDMRQAIRTFSQALKAGGVGLFYFAGHGVQSKGRNYLIPLNAEIKEEFELEDEAVDANRVLAGMEEAGNRVNIVILDACRDNPFGRAWRTSASGLAQLSAPIGSFVAFATAPGSVAADGSGRNGLFTSHLLTSLRNPDSDIDRVFTRVAAAVARESGNKQVPWKSSSLTGEFRFAIADQPVPPVAQSPAAPAAVTAEQEERVFWEDAKAAGNQEAYEAYLESYPKGRYASLARANLARLNAAKAAAQKLAADAAAERANKAEQERRAAEEAQKAAQKAASERVAAEAAAKEQQRLAMEAQAKEQARLALSAQEQARMAAEAAEAAAKEQQRLAMQAQAKEQARLALLAQEQARVAAEAAQKLAAARLAELPKPGQVIKDCSDCPEMVVIPGGSFTMGSNAAEQAIANAGGISASVTSQESPQHSVNIRSFAAARYAISKGEFAAFVRAKGYQTEAERGDGCRAWNGKVWKKDRAYNWRNVGFTQADGHPVVCVSWNDTQAYIDWLNQSTGNTFRLLSESEREYVARAGTQSAFWWGDSISTAQANYNGRATNYNGSPKGEYRQATVPVSSFNPNPFGLYNVHGNVWEWVEDCFHDTYNDAPADGSAWTTGCSASIRVRRGGSWDSSPSGLRSASRLGVTSVYRHVSGFRLARTLVTP